MFFRVGGMAMTNGSETVWDFSFFLHLSNHGFSARVSDWTIVPLAPGDFFFLIVCCFQVFSIIVWPPVPGENQKGNPHT